MTTFSRQTSLSAPTPVAIAGSPLTAAPFSALPVAEPSAEGFPRPFGDTGFMSRSPGTLRPGIWREASSIALDANFPPNFVGSQGNRILVQGGGFWALYDPAGRNIASDRNGPGPAFLHAAGDLLYYPDVNNFLVARRQRDGEIVFKYPIAYGEMFSKPLLAQSGNRLIMVSVEQEGAPHRPYPPDLSAVETVRVGAPLAVLPDKSLLSVERHEKLLIDSAGLVAGLRGDLLTLALPNRIVRADADLNIRAAFDGQFEPGLLSLDERGRAYMVVADEARMRALWVISEAGARIVATAFPENIGTLLGPPVVGLDHSVFVIGTAGLTAFSPSGDRLWTAKPHAEFYGGTVTSDGSVLVADGSELASFGPKGERQLLARFPLILRTPPVLLAHGRLLVAAQDRLYIMQQQ